MAVEEGSDRSRPPGRPLEGCDDGWFHLLLDVLGDGEPSAADLLLYLSEPDALSVEARATIERQIAEDSAVGDQAAVLRAVLTRRAPRPA